MITREMLIGEIIRQHPETVQVFTKYNLDCPECQIADFEELEHGAGVHHVDVDKLLEELNGAVEKLAR
jgi:hybrid cluster-associated redox disulfide protein